MLCCEALNYFFFVSIICVNACCWLFNTNRFTVSILNVVSIVNDSLSGCFLLVLTGNSFLTLSPDIESAYKEYLANYNHVTLVENSYKQKEALWNDIVRVIKASA